MDDQEIKEILVWMEYLDQRGHQDQVDDEVQLVPQVCSVCQGDQDHQEAEDLKVTEVWLDQPVTMVQMDLTDLLVTQEELENQVQLVQKAFQDVLVATDLPANGEPQVLQELQDHEADKERLAQLVKKVVLEPSEKPEPREPKVTED